MNRGYPYEKILELVAVSIHLDHLFLKVNDTNIRFKDRAEFILKKYLFIFSFKLNKIPFKLAQTNLKLWGKLYFPDSPFGLAGYQATLSRTVRELVYLKSKNHPIDTIFDVGANVGVFTLTCLKLFQPKSVYAFEPVPLTFQCLEKNTLQLPEVKAFNLGLSNFTGKSYMEFDPDNSALSKVRGSDGVEVNLTTLQNFVKEHNIEKIDLLKIDVESHEHLVLEGCGDFLSKVKFIYIEVTIRDNPNYTFSSLLSKLYGKGYNFQLVSFRNASYKSWGEIHFMDLLLENIEF